MILHSRANSEFGDGEQQEDKKFGTLVLAGEFQEFITEGQQDMTPFDVVAVHGIYGDRENTWTTDETEDRPGANWLIDRIYGDRPTARIITFGYDASYTRGGLYTRAAIREKAVKLLDDLVKLRKGPSKGVGRPLVFIAHDLGGIIVKEALWIATLENSKYRNIKDWTWILIFFGCPHRCHSTQDMEGKVAKLLFTNESTGPGDIARSIKELGRSIIEVNEAFAASKLPLNTNIVNIYSKDQDGSGPIFDKYTSTMELPFEERLGCQKAHKDMCKLAYGSDLYPRINGQICRIPTLLRQSEDSAKFLQTLRSLAAPLCLLESSPDSKDRLRWITADENYKMWFDSPGPSILHIHGTSGVSDASEFVYRCLDERRETRRQKEILIYFKFRKHDDRYNSVMAMLNTLLVQIFNEEQSMYDAMRLPFEEMLYHSGWTQMDLLLLFRNELSNWDRGSILCVIDGMDGCDESRTAFLENICTFASHTERRFKIAITSTADLDLQIALASWPAISLDNHQKYQYTVPRDLASAVDLEVLELIQDRPEFQSLGDRITEKLCVCGNDENLRLLFLNQLRLSKNPSTNSAIHRLLDSPPLPTSVEMFTRILAEVPLERQPWARHALVWILYTFHPLFVWDLGILLLSQDEIISKETKDIEELVYQNLVDELKETFKGIFIIKHNEVHFGHPDARQFLIGADGAQKDVWYDVKDTAHQEISKACFTHLSMQVQKSIEANYVNPSPPKVGPSISISLYNLRSYATKYWPRHYKLIPEATRPTKHALDFCMNKKAMRLWAEVYWSLWNPIGRTDGVFFSMLPILARLGLQDLVTKWLDPRFQQTTVEDLALALVEAARNGHIKVVRALLPLSRYSVSSLKDVLIAAASFCDEAVLDLLITHIVESNKNFEWPNTLLCRAAQFGFEKVIKNLLEHGASLDTAITLHDLTPLHLAARHGHVEVVKLLLESGASLTARAENGLTPLHIAVKYSHARVVGLLLDAHADCNAGDNTKTTALDYACKMGNHEVVRMLTKAHCDLGNDRQGEWSPLTVVADQGFLNSAKFLLAKEAKTEVQGIDGWTPLRHAAFKGHVEVCRLLLKSKADPNTSYGGAPILLECTAAGKIEVIKVLVENGAKINAVNSQKWTALQKASEKGHNAIVAYLLDHNANIHHVNDEGKTSLVIAALGNFAETVQLLINRRADLRRHTAKGWTALHLSYDFLETTRVLLKNGAYVNRVMSNGYTPIFLAASRNHPDVVKELLSYNPDLENQATYGYRGGHTALTAATLNGWTEVLRLLLEAGANINHRTWSKNFPLRYAVSRNKEDVLRMLLEYNPKLNLTNNDGDTALNSIVSSTSLAIAKILTNRGADTEARNNNQNTPLMKAVSSNNHEIVKYLAKRADINAVGGKRGGPIHIACYKLNLDLVKILVDAGANVNIVDPAVGTPLQAACRCRFSSYEKGKQESIICYLINEANANLKVEGGLYGCALNAACGRSSATVVKLMLQEGAKIGVKDEMGRVAIHFAADRSFDNFCLALNARADILVKDNMGRTALHWAAVSGMVRIVDRIISLSRGLVDQFDVDGWTPLLWAARGHDSTQKRVSSSAQEEVIRLLLDRGANPCVKGKVLGLEWSAVKVARYHGVDGRIIRLLKEKAEEKLNAEGGKKPWDGESNAAKKAAVTKTHCDYCLAFIYGICYKCKICLNFDLCYKCYRSRDLVHPSHHDFGTIGLEYVDENDSSDADSDMGSDGEESGEEDEYESSEYDSDDSGGG